MYMTFGKHEGKTIELLMIKEPKYVHWILNQPSPRGQLLDVKNHVMKLIKIFDAKPFIGKSCQGGMCDQPATRFAVYRDNLSSTWWCDTCNPHQLGAIVGNLQMLNDYYHALRHVRMYCRERVSDYRDLLGVMAKAKGLANKGEQAIQDFF